MEDVAARFRERIAGIALHAPAMVMVDNVGAGVDASAPASLDYWPRQIVMPVDFHGCVGSGALDAVDALVEIGPGSTLLGLGAKHEAARSKLLVPSLTRADKDVSTFLKGVASLYEAGVDIAWRGVHQASRYKDVPAYCFDRQKVFDLYDPRFSVSPGSAPADTGWTYALRWEMEAPAARNEAVADSPGDALVILSGDSAFAAGCAQGLQSGHAISFGSADFTRHAGDGASAGVRFDSEKLRKALQEHAGAGGHAGIVVGPDFLDAMAESDGMPADPATCAHIALRLLSLLMDSTTIRGRRAGWRGAHGRTGSPPAGARLHATFARDDAA